MTTISSYAGPSTEHRRGLIYVFLAGVLWSTVGLGVRLIDEAVVWQILLYRSISLSLFLYVVIRLRSGTDPLRLVRRLGWPGAVAGLALVGAYSGGIYAIQATSVASAMLLFATAPFIAAVLGWVFLRERVRRVTWIAIAVALVGIGIMVAGKASGTDLAGSLAAFGSAFGFAVFTVALRWGKSTEMLPSIFLSGLFAIVITLTICLWRDLPLVVSLNDGGIAMGMGVFQVGSGLILYTLGARSLPAAELTLLSLAEVLLAPVWVWLVLGETATINTLIGGSILLLAIAGNAITGAKPRSAPLAEP